MSRTSGATLGTPGERSAPTWFAKALRPWYQQHKRPLPWRATRDPYRVWLSEVILQQTRVEQGTAYWHRFVERYPTVADLAAADEDDVLKLWQGLGYYSRARNLLKAARQVMHEHNGRFPVTHAELMALSGVGDYSAAAIGSICSNVPEAVLDGNVLRVLARVFGIDTPIDTVDGRKRFRALAQDLLDRKAPGEHNQAVMELGATVCTPRNPDCAHCPLRGKCIALATDRIGELPLKAGRTKVRPRFFNYLHIANAGGIFMQQRRAKDIWSGLFEPPLLESTEPLDQRGMERALTRAFGKGWRVRSHSAAVKHVLSHQVIHAVFWRVDPPKAFPPPAHWKRCTEQEVHGLAVPKLIERWLASVGS